jgi:hypothetical protein
MSSSLAACAKEGPTPRHRGDRSGQPDAAGMDAEDHAEAVNSLGAAGGSFVSMTGYFHRISHTRNRHLQESNMLESNSSGDNVVP